MGDSGILVARKLVLLSTGARGAVYPLLEPKVGLGRDDENAIQLEGDSISRHHAVLERVNGEYVLRDLHSCNGTFLNDQLVQEAPLKPGDRLRLGDIELGYEAGDETTVALLPVGSVSASAEEIAGLRQQLAAVEQQLAAAMQQVSVCTAELDLARGKCAAAEEQSALQLQKSVQQKDALTADLLTARRQVEELRVAAGRAAEELVRASAESEITTNEQQQRITRLTTDVERLAAELAAGNEALQLARTELETLPDIRRESETLAQRGEALLAELAAEKELGNQVREAAKKQSAALQRATAKRTELVAAVKQLQAQLDQAQQSAGNVEQEKQLLTSELGAVREQMAVLQSESETQLLAEKQRAAELLLNVQADLDQAQQAASRLSDLTSQNDQLTGQNGELQLQIAALKLRETKVSSLEAEVTALQDTLKHLNDELVDARTTGKLEALKETLDRLTQMRGVADTTELAELRAELAKACVDWTELRQLPPVVDRLTRENEELRIAVAKTQEEATLAKRCLSDQTTEAFAQIRRNMQTGRRGKDGSEVGGKGGGLSHPLVAVRRVLGISPKK
jgi:chromosome segregation ATPase